MKILEAYVPSCLLGEVKEVPAASLTSEGLCPIRITCSKGCVSNIEIINNEGFLPMNILLPRFVEPHAHLDKAFTWQDFPNLEGTYEGALKSNLNEHKSRREVDIKSRANKALNLALFNGVRAIRSHIDSFGLHASMSWDVLTKVKNEWNSLIKIQLVALVPLDYWNTAEGEDFAVRVVRDRGLLGGVLVPPFDSENTYNLICKMLDLANRLGCEVDIHIDESASHPAEGLKLLINALDNTSIQVKVTCSHLSSMGLLPPDQIICLAERLATHNVNVIALPLTNAWLLGRQDQQTPVLRPIAPIKQLQKSGVNVAIGSDNLQDPWFPLGDLDPISLMSSSLPLLQLEPWNYLGLSPFTIAGAKLMKLEWDGLLKIGCPADFVLLKATNWVEALTGNISSRKIMIRGRWLEKDNCKEIN